MPDLVPVEADGALVDVVGPAEQIDQRALARAGAAHDGQRLAGLDLQRQILQHVQALAIMKADVVQHNVALDMVHGVQLRAVHDLRLLVEDVVDAVHAGDALGDVGDGVAEGQHGPDQRADVGVEFHEFAEGHHDLQPAGIIVERILYAAPFAALADLAARLVEIAEAVLADLFSHCPHLPGSS